MYPGKWAKEAPDRLAAVMTDSGDSITYKQLDDRSIQLSRWLHDKGLRRGDTVAILATNSVEHFEAFWACHRSGLYLTAINHHLLPSEVTYILNDCLAEVLIASADLAELATEAVEHAPGVKYRLAYKGAIDGFDDYRTTIQDVPLEEVEDDRAGRLMLYSSGTTGRPKGVRLALPEESVKVDGDG